MLMMHTNIYVKTTDEATNFQNMNWFLFKSYHHHTYILVLAITVVIFYHFYCVFILVRPRFTDAKIKSFMVVRAGNSARFNINFEVIY